MTKKFLHYTDPNLLETVNNNMTELLELDKDNNFENNQIIPKKKGRGGARPNSGRKPGSVQKLSGAGILAAIAQVDVPFEQGLAEDYARARASGDLHIIQRYQQMFLNKVVADKQEMDITSNGQTIGATFSFPSSELPDWRDEQPTKH